MVMDVSSQRIADLTAQHAVLATAIVLRIGDLRENLAVWSRTTRGFTPCEFLLLWNEVQSDVSRTHGAHSLVTRIQIFVDKKVKIDCQDLTVASTGDRGNQSHESN